MNTFIQPGRPSRAKPAAPTSRKDAKAATRALVLEVAKKHLEAQGYDGTSIRGVAQAAGVATGTVLLHFADKRDLLHAAVFEDLEATWHHARAKTVQGGRGFRGELSTIAKAFFDYYARRPALSRALLRESLFAEAPWNARFAAQVAEVHRHIASLAAAAKSRDELDPHIDVDLLGASFFAFYYFALLAWAQGGHPNPQRLFDRMLDQHLEARSTRLPRPKTTKRGKKP